MITAGVAFIDLGPLNTVVALVIATFKAMLVVLIFMHVKYASERLTKLVIVSGNFLSDPSSLAKHDGLPYSSSDLGTASITAGTHADMQYCKFGTAGFHDKRLHANRAGGAHVIR